MSAPRSFSWMPTWLRKFLNLDDELPRYGPSSRSSYQAAEPSAPPAVSYKPAQVSSYTPPTAGMATDFSPDHARILRGSWS